MKSFKTLNLSFLAMSVLLASCSDKSSDFFKRAIPNNDVTQVSLTGGSESGGENSPADTLPEAPLPTEETPKDPEVVKVPEVIKPPSEKDICEPLNEEGESVVYGYGLVGKLYDGAPNKIQSFKEVLEKGKLLESSIYMSQLNIPTRKFDKGFPRENGSMVMNSMGQVLIENFGIEFSGQLQLQDSDEAGYYEIGLIADDGVSLDLQTGPEAESLKNLIDGDHQTPTKFFCSKLLVRMEKGKSFPIRLRYFQGPRYHVALIMMWRKVESLENGSDELIKSALKKPVKETRCGIAGNKFFFDPDSDSHPQMEYLDLFDKTKRAVPWSMIKHKNLKLPAGYSNKQCVEKDTSV